MTPGLKREGRRVGRYQIAGAEGQFSEEETRIYRAAVRAIADPREAIVNLKEQLDGPSEAAPESHRSESAAGIIQPRQRADT